MTNRHKHPEDRRDAIIALARIGWKDAKIGRAFGMRTESVQYHLRRYYRRSTDGPSSYDLRPRRFAPQPREVESEGSMLAIIRRELDRPDHVVEG